MSIPVVTLRTHEKTTASLLAILGSLVTEIRERDLPVVWSSEPAGIVDLVPLNDDGLECDIEARRVGSAQVKAKVGDLVAYALINVIKKGATYLEIKLGPVTSRIGDSI